MLFLITKNDKYLLMFSTDVTVLEKYPHLIEKVRANWGTKECREWLTSLLSDSRDGSRAGFPPADAKVIFALLKEHDVMFPRFDTTHDIIIPFSGKARPVENYYKPHNGPNIFNIIGYIIGAALLVGIGTKVYKWISPLI